MTKRVKCRSDAAIILALKRLLPWQLYLEQTLRVGYEINSFTIHERRDCLHP